MPDGNKSKGGVLRRQFLQGAGLTMAGTALLNVPGRTLADEPNEPAVRPGLKRYAAQGQPVTLHINGEAHELTVTPQTTLLHVLREKLDLTGAKEVCDRGACGACTVLVNGKAMNSCMTLAVDVIDQQVTTVEGLARDDRLDPVQQAFVKHDASQCGYCIPGFVVSAKALLDEHPNATREQIKAGLCGNICRCAAYVRIHDAVAEAAGEVTP